MAPGSSADQDEQRTVFHVACKPLPVGYVLRPYTIALECGKQLQMAAQARSNGLETVMKLIGSDRWHRAGGNERYAAQLVLLEAAFEWVRVDVAPTLPSRLDAVFVWDTAALARRYCDTYRTDGTIHSCRVLSGRQIKRDGALIVEAYETANLANPSMEDLLRLEEHATRYWRAEEPLRFAEVLVQGTVVVDARVDANEAQMSPC